MKDEEKKATNGKGTNMIWIGATVILAILLILSLLLGWQIPGKKGKTGAAKEVSPELLGDLRTAFGLPSDSKVLGVTDLEVGMVSKVSLETPRGSRTRTIDVYVSEDEQFILIGNVFSQEQLKELIERRKVTSAEKIDPAQIPIAGRPAKGPADAPITIVEFSEFQCPYCGRAANTVNNQVLKEYGDKVKLVFKHFPLSFHKWAEPAAVASECAFQQNNDAFWYFFDKLFGNQRSINEGNVKEKCLQWAKEANLDVAKFTSCYDNKETLDRVKQDMQEGQGIGISGVPAFFVNGKKLSGAQPYEKFKE
ncbi:MAG: DsbA family protein, partial [Deltaproteobacteria bacterium]